jgi:hypothetical protein
VGKRLHRAWQGNKFDFIPTEKNLLTSLWYDRDFHRRSSPKETAYDFLDYHIRYIKKHIVDPRRQEMAKELNGYFLQALEHKQIRELVIEFLELPLSEENYPTVMKAIRSAWRVEEVKIEDKEEDGGDEKVEEEKSENVEERLLHTKAYIIAVQLYFETEGEEEEFESLCRRLPDLKRFIREKFGVERMPGRLEDFKGYSYKPILKGKNSAKKGQLRMPFRQIAEHPEIFGEVVAGRAREIIEEHFK